MESEARFRRLAENAPDIIFRYEHKPIPLVSYVSPAVFRILGRTPEDYYSDPELLWQSVHPDDAHLLRTVLAARGGESTRMIRWCHLDGSIVYLSIRVSPVTAASGELLAVEGIARDITSSIEAEQELRESENRYRTLVEAMGDDIILIVGRDGCVEYANNTVARVLETPPREIGGQSLKRLLGQRASDDFSLNLDIVLDTAAPRRFECCFRLGGVDFWMDISLAPLKDKAGAITGALAVGRDVTELITMREELRALSLVDDLTGLYNRRGFSLLASQQLKMAERAGKSASLLMGDLDGLKAINDIYGHLEGDAALVAASRILKETCRESDVVGRLGGDEFAVLAVGDSPPASAPLSARLSDAIDAWNAAARKPYRLSLSIGVADFEIGGIDSLESLLFTADRLMYQHKRMRRSPRRPSF